MFLRHHANLPGRIPGDNGILLNILRNDRPGPNNRIPADPYPWQYRGIGTDAGPLFDNNAFQFHLPACHILVIGQASPRPYENTFYSHRDIE